MYDRIHLHLQEVYKRKFSYGSVVQLCVPRNKKRLAAKRYRSVAMVTTRRARKGFNLRYNPDSHFSSALYKGLNSIHLRDGRDTCLINRDDAAGFRLDTMTTCKQYAQPTVCGKDVLTTRTDYVNKYPSTLQTTCYNFTETETTQEVCVGVVKAPSIHLKNPCQHSADLQLLETKEELKSVFYNLETGMPKSVDCIRVDGASDEGPTHEEVQYYWTRRHLLKSKAATIVTTRSSGSSYLNRVELQNGCLSRGHSNTFIPSTIGGSCVDPNTGAINKSKLQENFNLVIDAYINRVNGCSCGETIIHLYRGADSTRQQEMREKLLIFLKGSNAKKELLRKQEPALYDEFQLIWRTRKNHMVHGLPSYFFFLLCCYEEECPHPLCKRGPPRNTLSWYPGGPPINHLPLPVPDPERPWGSTDCSTCKGFCCGHYTTTMVSCDNHSASVISKPPSVVLKEEFAEKDKPDLESIAKKVLLPTEECRIWLDHLQTILNSRRRGAQKAAATRRANRSIQVETPQSQVASQVSKSDQECFCGDCGEQYEQETEESELWIECSLCEAWYHGGCQGLSSASVPSEEEDYICLKCRM